jgi:regulatory protein
MDDDCLRALALKLLAGREHSRAELRRKLAAKCDDDGQLSDLLHQLGENGLQSDQRFTELYAESRRKRGFGPVKIRAELLAKGVGQALVDAALTLDETIWDEALLEVVRQRFGASAAADYREWSKRARFLEYRGFAPARIRRLLPQ